MLTPFAPGASADAAHRALQTAVGAEEDARRCAVLWFAEILRRRLFVALGYSSMPQYARHALGFSETRVGDFMHLCRKLDALPAVRDALPEIGYTKAREIVRVASPRSQRKWVAEARAHSRTELRARIKRVKARSRRGGGSLFDAPAVESPRQEPSGATGPAVGAAPAAGPAATPAAAPADLPTDPPVRVTLELTSEQFARWEAAWERLARRGVGGGRAEILLAALAEHADPTGDDAATGNGATTRRRAVPPFQIHVHRCPDCGREEAGGRALDAADRARVACDAAVDASGRRNAATIPPRVRRRVLARDRHRCRAPGCGRTRFLEVHHVVPRAHGGGNDPENLVTLCAACHRLWHHRGRCGPLVGAPPPPRERTAAAPDGAPTPRPAGRRPEPKPAPPRSPVPNPSRKRSNGPNPAPRRAGAPPSTARAAVPIRNREADHDTPCRRPHPRGPDPPRLRR